MANWNTNKGRFDILNRYLLGSGGAADLRLLAVDTPPASAGAAADLNFVTQITSDELAGTGYSRMTLANEVAAENDTSDLANIDADDPSPQTLAGDNGTIAGYWLFRFVTNDSDSILLQFFDTTDTVTNGGAVQFAFGATGAMTLASG